MFRKEFLSILTVAILALAASEVRADLLNGSMEFYRTGTDPANSDLGTFFDGAGYVQGIGVDRNVDAGAVEFASDPGVPSLDNVDVPHWANIANPDNNLPNIGQGGVSGSNAMSIFAAWGGGDGTGNQVEGATSDQLAANTNYTISALITGEDVIGGGVIFWLNAGGSELGADGAAEMSDMDVDGFRTITRFYSIGSVTPGADLTVVLGSATTNTAGGAMQWDNVSLSGVAIPEPASLAILGLGGLGMLVRRRR